MVFLKQSFDYLIIGGGTAGLAVATRLSENPNVQVVVLEAGPSALNGEDGGAITVPGRYGETIGSEYDWKFQTKPQLGMANRCIDWPRGRVLGGTSALNFMAWNRGDRRDYDAWEKLGNAGWGWDDLLPYFLRSETFHPPSAAHQKHYNSAYQAEFNGTQGPINTTHIKQYGPAHQYWHETMNALGIPSSEDSLGGVNIGAYNLVCSIDPGQQIRSYAASAYYKPIAFRDNLTVLTNATVLNLLLEESGSELKATGARVRHDECVFEVEARREVILSAGSVQSPQILEISGIGRPDILKAAGIEVKLVNQNVGEKLLDHMMFATVYEVLPILSSKDDIANNPILREAADSAYHASKTGPWTVMPCSVAYCSLSAISSKDDRDELKLKMHRDFRETRRISDLGTALMGEEKGHIEYIFDLGNWSPFFESEPGKKYATMLQMLQYPQSHGSIHIRPRSDDNDKVTIDEKPIIDPRYYFGVGQLDKEVMAWARKFADKICQTEPLAKIIKERVFPPLPSHANDEDKGSKSDSEIMEKYTITDWHPIGTCSMGGSGGATDGVVDERLRVYGVQGLRVIDASIMPSHIGAHIQATVYAIAEKGAAMIKEDWKYN